ncbi:signal protein [Actinomadura soli]|uniref:Signal protein n=1 Tax=Actinomadura soli TaxID=2508997 RepID=A0A5C4JB63_9ACTN|nr:signal protein [Actinomadura soli]TMR00131.1 signal protein [Actinomadura soli]
MVAVVALISGCGSDNAGPSPGDSNGRLSKARQEKLATEKKQMDQALPGEIQTQWWKWAASTPRGRNPVEDETGTHCAAGQGEFIWNLAGTFGGSVKRRCTMPSQTLVVPVVNLLGSQSDCAAFMAAARGRWTVDGVAQPVQRWEGSPITVDSVAGNPVTGTAGQTKGYACGFWGFIAQGGLAPGKHKISIRGSSGDFHTSVDYDLTVAAAKEPNSP